MPQGKITVARVSTDAPIPLDLQAIVVTAANHHGAPGRDLVALQFALRTIVSPSGASATLRPQARASKPV